MKMVNFLFDFLYQIVTWVCIALAIGSLFYFLSKGNSRGVIWSSVGLLCSIAVMIGIVADHYFSRSEQPKSPLPTERPYVFIEHTSFLEPLTPGKNPVLMIYLTNSGSVEATGFFENLSYYWTSNTSMNCFPYYDGKRTAFSLAPTGRVVVRFKPNLVLTEEIANAIADGSVRLFFYAKGEYSDSGGRSYPLSFCRQYDRDMPSNLIICDDDITFEEAKK